MWRSGFLLLAVAAVAAVATEFDAEEANLEDRELVKEKLLFIVK